MSNLIKNFQNFSHEHSLWKKGDKIVLGISGGPDSVCLLDIFLKLKAKYNLELILAHVNYGLRGYDSGADEKFVRNLAGKNNLKVVCLNLKNPKAELSEFLKLGFRKKPNENILRDIRYEFFEKVRQENKFNLIGVAHNADDQVETFFLHLLRGAGKNGLAGMKAKNGEIIRPLLFSSKKDILEYLKDNKISFRLDKTNKENKFTRNKVRNSLIPYLEKNFNPNIKKAILRAIENLTQEEKNQNNSTGLQGITSSHLREIIKILKSPKNKCQVFTFQGLKVERRGDKLIIEKLKK
jgi:tRNA(Ile)-lysidine synthase